jgi:hypothetical protein
MKHSSSFYYDLDFGEKGEDWLNELFKDGKKVEVKTDRAAHYTGNVYVEVYSRGKASGISTTQASYWIFIIDKKDYSLFVSVQKLRDICKIMHQINGLTKGGDEDTSRGILIPIKLIIE